jgi:hypothetical protein
MGRLRERQEGRSSRTEEARLVDRSPLWLSAQVDLPGEDRNFGFGLFVDLCPTVVADQCLRRVIPIPGDPEGEPNAGSGAMIDAYAPVAVLGTRQLQVGLVKPRPRTISRPRARLSTRARRDL